MGVPLSRSDRHSNGGIQLHMVRPCSTVVGPSVEKCLRQILTDQDPVNLWILNGHFYTSNGKPNCELNRYMYLYIHTLYMYVKPQLTTRFS